MGRDRKGSRAATLRRRLGHIDRGTGNQEDLEVYTDPSSKFQ